MSDQILDMLKEVIENKIIVITFSNKKYQDYKYQKITVRLVENFYQITKYTETQVFHQNVKEDVLLEILKVYANNYKQIDGKTEKGNYNIRINKRANVLKRFTKANNKPIINSHDRQKNYVIKDYQQIQVLKDLKIISKDNKIIESMSDKFRQINKYIELVDDLISFGKHDKLKIVDLGAGKSYLTFVLYHYLTYTKKIDTEIIGVDLKESVIKDNIDLAEKYNYKKLNFICGDISDIEVAEVDMVISLHACDIATDLALDKALQWQVQYIVAVPCCQNEVYKQLKSKTFSQMIQYGIVKERLSALITDTVRANILEYSGYQTQVIEYVDSDHSLKNLMIRAKFTDNHSQDALKNILNLQNEFQFSQKLLELRNIGLKYD